MRSTLTAGRRSSASRVIVAVVAAIVFVSAAALLPLVRADDAVADKKPAGVYQCKIFSGRIHPHNDDDKWRQELEDRINDWYAANPDIEYVTPSQTQGGTDPSVQAITYTITYKNKR